MLVLIHVVVSVFKGNLLPVHCRTHGLNSLTSINMIEKGSSFSPRYRAGCTKAARDGVVALQNIVRLDV